MSPLTFLINQCISNSEFPSDLKIAKVLPLFKKDDPSQITNYRPISLLPAISKIYERVVFQQLMIIFSQRNLFHTSQYGYRKGHSTELAALELVDRVSKALDAKKSSQHCLAIFMDLSKAFDTLDHSILLRKLAHYGLGPLSCKLIDSYLSHREQYVQLENAASSRLPISTGVPQGSVLGPILFLIYLNDIENVCPLLDTICYADDTTLLFNFEKLNLMKSINHVISNFVNEQLEKIHVWMMTNKLSLNINTDIYHLYSRGEKAP